MNEPFLLSNLVEIQDLDNKIYKLNLLPSGIINNKKCR